MGQCLPVEVEARLATRLTEKFNTDVRMLTQFGPLEGQAVDNLLCVGTKPARLKRCSATWAMGSLVRMDVASPHD